MAKGGVAHKQEKEIYPATEAPEPSKKAARRVYTAIDLFAGCGGLSLGLENSGFTPIFVNELNEDALSTYLRNRHHSLGGLKFADNRDLRCNDAYELTPKRLDKLKADLSGLKEAEYKLDKGTASKGAGSNLDIIAGGPPCQGFSGIGHRRSYGVDKEELPSNHLYVQMANVISSLRPRIFLFENVRGLLNSKWTRESDDFIWPDVLAEYRKIPGYTVRWSLVHAKNYGVPQNRPRVLLVGIRNDILSECDFVDASLDPNDAVTCGFLPQPEAGSYPTLEELLSDLVDPLVPAILRTGDFGAGAFETTKYPSAAQTAIQKKLRKSNNAGAGGKVVLTEHEYSKHKPDVVQKFSYMLKHDGKIPEKFQTKKFSQRVLPAEWGKQGPTITATSLPDDYVHYSQPRILTVREWARLQLFPDWYEFSGKRTTGGIRRAGNPQLGIFDREVPKYTQIGNAVPVGLAERVGLHFKKILDSALN